MTEIQNSKQLVSDIICDLVIVFWSFFVIWCLFFGIYAIPPRAGKGIIPNRVIQVPAVRLLYYCDW